MKGLESLVNRQGIEHVGMDQKKKKREPELSSQHKPVKTKGYFKTENKWKAIRQIKIKRTLDSIFNIKQQLKEKKHDEAPRKILNMKK